jgi:hypothetical protein
MLRALAVVLTNLTRVSGMLGQTSQDRDSIIQALHVLDVLDQTAIPRRIANFAREYLTLLAKSGIVASPSPLKDRYRGTPPPGGHMSNFDDHLPRHTPPIGNFDDHLSQPTPMMVYNGAMMNGFTMLQGHDLRPPPAFLPSSYHGRPS